VDIAINYSITERSITNVTTARLFGSLSDRMETAQKTTVFTYVSVKIALISLSIKAINLNDVNLPQMGCFDAVVEMSA